MVARSQEKQPEQQACRKTGRIQAQTSRHAIVGQARNPEPSQSFSSGQQSLSWKVPPSDLHSSHVTGQRQGRSADFLLSASGQENDRQGKEKPFRGVSPHLKPDKLNISFHVLAGCRWGRSRAATIAGRAELAAGRRLSKVGSSVGPVGRR